MIVEPPQTENELWLRACALAGMQLKEVAKCCLVDVPVNLQRDKGWVGQLLEKVLGADAANHAAPDFTQLGIELKTIPIREDGTPLESTFVSVVPLIGDLHQTWRHSVVYQKLQRVLWIPMLAEKHIEIGDRTLGHPLLWSPSPTEEALLQRDWEELTDMVCLGQLEKITARLGQVLQIRPKGASSKDLAWGIAESGDKTLTLPRGFYLRPTFTKSILLNNLQNALQC